MGSLEPRFPAHRAELLTFDIWPDMTEYPAEERFPAPGFTHPDGSQASLFSADHPATVLRHFRWMRDYGIDGAWLQHFLVDLPPDGKVKERYTSRLRVLNHVRAAANQTGRAWALSYDIAGMRLERIYDVLTADWKKQVDTKVIEDPRYLHEGGRPVVQIWGFYHENAHDPMTAELANRLIDFFHAAGPYRAYLVGGGDWNWRRNADPEWQGFLRRFDAYAPWNVGNRWIDQAGDQHASTQTWADDQRACEKVGMLWMPVVYPGFSWDHLKHLPPGTSGFPRRGGRFLWEQLHTASQLGAETLYVAMFDEVDEGTAIFKIADAPPTQAHFVSNEGLPSDWYLRLVGEAARRLHEHKPVPQEIPFRRSRSLHICCLTARCQLFECESP